MQKLFLDTNFVIDFLGERADFYYAAARVMTLADHQKIKVFTSPTTISTAFYLLAKYENRQSALQKIRKFKVLCAISLIDDDVVDKSLNSDFKDFEDALQYFSAVSSNCDIILTRNEKDFKNALIPVLSAESYLQTLRHL